MIKTNFSVVATIALLMMNVAYAQDTVGEELSAPVPLFTETDNHGDVEFAEKLQSMAEGQGNAVAFDEESLEAFVQGASTDNAALFTIEDLLKTQQAEIEKRPFKARFSIRSKRTNHGETFILTNDKPEFEYEKYTIIADQCLKDYEGLGENDVAFVKVYLTEQLKAVIGEEDSDISDTEAQSEGEAIIEAELTDTVTTLMPDTVFQGWLYRLYPSASGFYSPTHQLAFLGCIQ